VFSSDERSAKEDLIDKMMQAIETLPEEERGILRGKYLEGRRYEELARRYNLSYNAAVVKAHRTRRKVRDIVLRYEIECAKKSALRGDVLSARHHLWFLIKHVANVCLYFNGKYYPGTKNILAHLSRCNVLPTDCIQHLESITLNPDAKKAVQECIRLAQEVLELTRDILPEEQRKLAFDELEWFSRWDGRL